MLCPECGSEVPEGSKFCNQCGKSVNAIMDMSERAPGSESAIQSPPPANDMERKALSGAAVNPTPDKRQYNSAPPNTPKNCPKCGLVIANPESAHRCDCGYDFATGQMAGCDPVTSTPVPASIPATPAPAVNFDTVAHKRAQGI